jgi:Fe-S-cluster-containing hydrogenase component 2
MAKVFMIHPERCTGCQNCRMACSFSHENQFRPAAARVQVFTSEREGYSVPMMCQQCDAAPCMKVCPTGALYRASGSTGRVRTLEVHGLPYVHHGLPLRQRGL